MKITVFVSALLMALSSASLVSTSFAASTYKWTDDQGNTHYSQHPPRDRESERLKIKTPRPTRGYEAPPPANNSASQSGLPGGSSENSTIKAETESNLELRKKNCEAAKKNLQVYQVYRRVRDEEGKVTRLNPEEREKRIQETKDQINEFCD